MIFILSVIVHSILFTAKTRISPLYLPVLLRNWLASGLHLADNYDGENVADDDAATTDDEDF